MGNTESALNAGRKAFPYLGVVEDRYDRQPQSGCAAGSLKGNRSDKNLNPAAEAAAYRHSRAWRHPVISESADIRINGINILPLYQIWWKRGALLRFDLRVSGKRLETQG